jgi:hypothetical protein
MYNQEPFEEINQIRVWGTLPADYDEAFEEVVTRTKEVKPVAKRVVYEV